MGDMDDQLQKVAEQLFDQMDHDLTVRFPHRRADIAALLTVAGPPSLKLRRAGRKQLEHKSTLSLTDLSEFERKFKSSLFLNK